jgi:hypothetical protein
VDHPLAAPESLVRPWRTAAIVAGAIALVELILLLVIGGGLLAQTVSHRLERAARHSALSSPSGARTPAAKAARRAVPTPVAKLPRSRTKVLVLNGNGRTGAAARAATRVRRRGYQIQGVGNAPRSNFSHDVIMFRPGFAGEGRRLAQDLGVKLVGPLDGIRVRDLHGAHLILILGA